jgi:tetratricopeptide (TPR) repeat protein/transposase-like protein/transcriptional regulator with XRE-family HTH domain
MQRNEHLRRQRIGRNWRQLDLADQLGVTTLTIQRWERGAQRPSAYYRVKLCTLFGLNAQELGLVDLSPTESLPGDADTQAVNARLEEPLLWTVPYARNPHFTGRDELLEVLEQLFAEEPSHQTTSIRQAALTQTQAIKGLGGIGKTQIAVEYAYRACKQGRYNSVIWISAASEEAILTSFVALARLLPASVRQEETNPHALVAAILRWLEQRVSPWLLIFDNADDLSLVQAYFPRQGNGSILLTTRANAVGAVASSIEVDTMSIIEGTQLLLRRAHRGVAALTPADMDDATNVVVALAHFPLAIDQAGAYIEETGCTLRDYLQLYQRYRHQLLARRGRQATGYPESVVTTWSLSFAQVERTNPAAAELLQLCALLAPDRIPEELLAQGAAFWPTALQQAVADPLTFNQMLETLLAFSLVKRFAEDRLLSIHRLVQAVQLERMDVETQHAWRERMVRAIQAVFPVDPTDVAAWPQCLRYLDQVEACTALIQQHQLLLPEAAELFDCAGTYFLEHAMYPQAESLYQRALTIREQLMGETHPDTATSLHHLALLQRANGNYTQAEPLFQRALAIREQQLGPLHLDTAESLYGLARLYESHRAFVKAEPLFQRALAIREQQLGPFHLDTVATLNGLSILYDDVGRYEEAEPLFQRVLAIREQQLGPLHNLTGNALNNLAAHYSETGRYADAEPLYERMIAIKTRLFGALHFETAVGLHNLATLYTRQGRYEEAEPLCQQALAIYEQHLGPLHSHTADCLIGLAALYLKMGKYPQAELLAQQALHIHEEHLGALHPYVANDLMILASLNRNQGNYADAEPSFLRALHINGQVLVSTHPQAAEALYEFALLRQAQGHYDEARALFERALAARAHTLGAAHPLTLETRARLDALLGTSVRTEETQQSSGASISTSRSLLREAASVNVGSMLQENNTTSISVSARVRVRVACPQCHQTVGVLKSGKNRAGSQRFRCRACHLYFTPEPIPRQHDEVRQAEALVLANQGMSYRSIARQLGVHHQTVSAWIGTHDADGAD